MLRPALLLHLYLGPECQATALTAGLSEAQQGSGVGVGVGRGTGVAFLAEEEEQQGRGDKLLRTFRQRTGPFVDLHALQTLNFSEKDPALPLHRW